MLETGLENIKKAGIEKEDENYSFRELLKTFPQADLDLWFGELSREISPLIDCLACGNCCRTYMISINQAEAERIAGRLGMGLSDFEKKYTETGLSGMQVFNRIPCHFLCSGKKCCLEK